MLTEFANSSPLVFIGKESPGANSFPKITTVVFPLFWKHGLIIPFNGNELSSSVIILESAFNMMRQLILGFCFLQELQIIPVL